MKRVSVDEIENSPHPEEIHDVRRRISPALGVDNVSINYYELRPGEYLSGGLHAHTDQEEIFYVDSGVAIFEVGTEGFEVTVEAGELIRFELGEFQVGRNGGNETLICWGFGAPGDRHNWDALKSYELCPTCSKEQVHKTGTIDDGIFELICENCGSSRTLK